MSHRLVAQAEITANRLRDAARRNDHEDILRIVNNLGLQEARALVAGMAAVYFRNGES